MNVSHAEEPVRCAGSPRCSNWRHAESQRVRVLNAWFLNFIPQFSNAQCSLYTTCKDNNAIARLKRETIATRLLC
ncbi:hypothetical protein [Chlorogloeopsis fritschii]|uniref:hypothetical protein n=1 Tax=Chlorogloeopsis fritschii TaxID=1124 RepID=UPI0012FD53E5|nr:hypothetical protein [Chlorogloeopsis fritschii]